MTQRELEELLAKHTALVFTLLERKGNTMTQKELERHIGKGVAIVLKNKTVLMGTLRYEKIPTTEQGNFFPMTQTFVMTGKNGVDKYFRPTDVLGLERIDTEPQLVVQGYGTGKSYATIGMLAKARKGSKK